MESTKEKVFCSRSYLDFPFKWWRGQIRYVSYLCRHGSSASRSNAVQVLPSLGSPVPAPIGSRGDACELPFRPVLSKDFGLRRELGFVCIAESGRTKAQGQEEARAQGQPHDRSRLDVIICRPTQAFPRTYTRAFAQLRLPANFFGSREKKFFRFAVPSHRTKYITYSKTSRC